MQQIARALQVLRTLARSSVGMSLAELAERLEIPVASVHRLLKQLEEEGFVTRSPLNRRYFIGPASREIAAASPSPQSALVDAHAAVVAARRETGETVFLAEYVHGRVTCIALEESRRSLRMFVRVGELMPLHAASAARSILAWRDQDEVRSLLMASTLEAYTPKTLTTVADVMQHLEGVRRRGFDVCDAELDPGVWAMAAPIRSSTGEVVASVAVTGPASRLKAGRTREVTDVILHAAEVMSADLGWTGEAP